MSEATSPNVTQLLVAWGKGDQHAFDALMPEVRKELHRLAAHYMAEEPAGHDLQPTALINEAYLRLVDVKGVDWQDRAHFLAVAARIMRRILVDAARARASAKRGGEMDRVDHFTAVEFDQLPERDSDCAAELVALDDALNRLTELDPRRVQVIELRFFGGLTVEETAGVLNVSPQTVMRDWKLARAWLARELRR